MLKIIKSEFLKSRHTFAGFLPVLAPLFTLLLVFVLMGGGNFFAAGAWNWWYTLLLPEMSAVLCCLGIAKDKKIKYYNLLFLPVSLGRCVIGKIIYCFLCLTAANFVIFIGVCTVSELFGTTNSVLAAFLGFILLSITYLWEIPLFIMISSRFNMLATVFSCMVLSVSSTVAIAATDYWWVCPAAVPVRLMCPVLGILPNGLLVPENSKLLDTSVIFTGVILSLIWFILMTYLAVRWFRRKAVNE